jgi:hypothetical protein
MKKVFFKGFLIAGLLLSLSNASVNAQAVTLPCDNPGNNQANENAFGPHVEPCPASTEAPFDGGLSVLIAAGVGLGLKRRNDKKKKQEQEAVV